MSISAPVAEFGLREALCLAGVTPCPRRPVSTRLVRGLWVKVKVSRAALGLGEGLCKVPRRVYVESAGCWSVVSKEEGLFPLGSSGGGFLMPWSWKGRKRSSSVASWQVEGGG